MTQNEAETISRIQEAIQSSEGVSASEVKGWLRLAVQSVATDFLLQHSRRIQPPLAMRDICDAAREYYRKCLTEDHASELVPRLRSFNRTFSSIPTAPTNHLPDGWTFTKKARGQKGAD
jgi:hypothetical protein